MLNVKYPPPPPPPLNKALSIAPYSIGKHIYITASNIYTNSPFRTNIANWYALCTRKKVCLRISMQYRTKTVTDTIRLGQMIGRLLQAGDVLALQGALAAGKTQLTKGIAQGLDIFEPVTSPTFTIISEYYGRLPLYHMDVYRLGTPEEFLDLGIDDMLYGQGVCIIEWSEKVMSELPASTIRIEISVQEDSSRTVTLTNWPYPTDSLTEYEVIS